MKMKALPRAICFLLTLTVLLGSVGITSSASLKEDPTGTEKYPYTVPSLEDMKDLVGVLSYEEYMEDFASLRKDGLTTLTVDITKFDGNGVMVGESQTVKDAKLENPENWLTFGSENDSSTVYLPSSGETSWQIKLTAEQSGLYYIRIQYYNCITSESSVSSIERMFKIDGKVPFDEVATISFNKNWKYDNITVVESEGEEDDYRVEYEHIDDDKDPRYGYWKTVTYVKNGKKTVTTYKLSQDINGNSMAPVSKASPTWNTYYLQDATGFYSGYFNFYFAEGTHSITLGAERDPMIIKSIELVPVEDETALPTYEEILAGYEKKGYTAAEGGDIIQIEAEFPDMISDSSVNPSNDNTSAVTSPVVSSAQLYNVIGETSYSSVGQWAAYKFTVNEDGMYRIGMRFKQDGLQGMFSCRSIKIAGGEEYRYGLSDGSPEAPFAEAQNIRFDYSKDWQSSNLGYVEVTGEGKDIVTNKTDYLFYFEAGVEYTLYIECSLGELRTYIQTIENSLNRLNDCYLRIIQRTGSTPDENQSYDFHKGMLDVLVTLLEEAKTLERVSDELETLCRTTGSHLATLDTISRILDTMGKDNGEQIAANMSTFKSYLGTLGTWITDSKNGKLMMDTIVVIPADKDDSELPEAQPNFFESIWLEITSFIYSFFTDYDQMGLTVEPDENTAYLDVWLAMGRDQSQIWRTMIDAEDGFTKTTQNAVALKLVTGGTLLPSILAGKGPDVYMGLGSAEVINYAIRDAVLCVNGKADELTTEENSVFTTFLYRDANGNEHRFTPEQIANQDMSGFTLVSEDFNTFTTNNFAPAAMNTLTLLEKCYGIPMTMSFAMMFYRMDVLAELGEEVPESWDQLIDLLPTLQVNNMTIGVTYVSALDFMMYQRGGNMWKFNDNPEYAGAAIDLDSDIALEAFEFVCSLYTDHSLPVAFDASNRFRTGEMPIVIGDYASIYNTLTIYATEIEGLWEFSSLPGSDNAFEEDGFNYDSLAGISATVIPNGCDDFEAAWEFVQWQTSAKVQAEYGNKIVALIGPAAKYETANINAIEDLSWTANEKAAIRDQMANLNAIVNYPGSYIISRYMKFAFLDAYNDGANAVEAMLSYINAINGEITRKREEFGLKTMDDYREEHKDEAQTAMRQISSLAVDM